MFYLFIVNLITVLALFSGSRTMIKLCMSPNNDTKLCQHLDLKVSRCFISVLSSAVYTLTNI